MDSLADCLGNEGADVPTAGGSKPQRSSRLAVRQPVLLDKWPVPHGRLFVSRLLSVAKWVQALHDVVRLDGGCSDLRF